MKKRDPVYMKDIAIEVNLVDVCGAPYRDRLLEMVPSSTDPSSYKTFKLFDASPSFCRSFLIVSVAKTKASLNSCQDLLGVNTGQI
jgi:hypothetical protein